MTEHQTILTLIASWLTMSVSVYRLFKIPNESVKPESKRILSSWILKLNDNEIDTNRALGLFAELFDSVFGTKKLSLSFVLKSIIASFISTFIAFLIIAIYDYDIVEGNILTIVLLGLPLLFNLVPDYLSLIETRWLLGKMTRSHSVIRLIAFFVIDLLFTLLIFILWTCLLITLLALFKSDDFNYLFQDFNETGGFLVFFSDLTKSFLVIYLISTFCNSKWIWLYVLSAVTLRAFNGIIVSFKFFKKHLDIENNPFKSLGSFLVIVITILHAAYWVKLIFVT